MLVDLLAKPNSLDCIVFTPGSELRRWCSCKDKSARIVFMDSDVHCARVGVVVVLLLNSSGNANYVKKGDDGKKIVAAAP